MTLSRLHVDVHVEDIDEASRFYTDELGLQPLGALRVGIPVSWLVAGNGLRVHLVDGHEPIPLARYLASADVPERPADLGRQREATGTFRSPPLPRSECSYVSRRASGPSGRIDRSKRPHCSRDQDEDTGS